MSDLTRAIIKADVGYFYKNKFISRKLYRDVLQWLDGTENREVEKVIADWLESDALYLEELAPAICHHHWFIWPFVWVMMKAGPMRLRKEAEELELREGSL